MIILGIETSCDETALSLLETRQEKDITQYKVLHNAVLSQIKLHEQYGGVFPMMAKREHAKNLVPLLVNVLEKSGLANIKKEPADAQKIAEITALLSAKEKELLAALLNEPALHNKPHVDTIAVTNGPGLEPALWVGVNFAKALSILWNIPAIPVNHMEGHIVASLLDPKSDLKHLSLKPLALPALALLISGGHTELVLINDIRDYSILGATRDDAVGEAFDKVARLLGLPYPGGPQISKLAHTERAAHPAPRKIYNLPRPMIHTSNYEFSFSGIKTSVLYTIRDIKEQGKELTDDIKQQIAREFEDAVTEVLIFKTKKAIEASAIQTLIIGGGVIANTYIRSQFEALAKKMNIVLLLPQAHLSTDNALMIALAGALMLQGELPEIHTIQDFKAQGNLSL